MAETDWKIEKPTAACTACQAGFTPETPYFSALFLNAPQLEGQPATAGEKPVETKQDSGLVRRDYCVACFQNKRPENVYYFWKTQLPVEDPEARKGWKQRPAIDIDYVFDFFKRLENETAAQQVAFRYILALMLSRKKLLIAEGRSALANGTTAQIFAEKRGGAKHTVLEPSLSEDEIGAVSAELGVLLGIAPPPQKTPTAADAAVAGAQSGEEKPAGEGETVESATAGGGGKGASE